MTLTHAYQYCYKISSALIGASLVTLGLLLFMQQLIQMDAPPLKASTPPITVPIMAPKPKIDVRKDDKPKQPPAPIEQPKTKFEPIEFTGPTNELAVLPPTMTGPTEIDPGASANGNAISMMTIAPTYPERARNRGIEGYVDLVFDLTATGKPVNIRILAAEPKGYFEKASKRALQKWKYKPAMEDGKAIAMYDMTTRISYTLDK